jgi:hypothetical protein
MTGTRIPRRRVPELYATDPAARRTHEPQAVARARTNRAQRGQRGCDAHGSGTASTVRKIIASP